MLNIICLKYKVEFICLYSYRLAVQIILPSLNNILIVLICNICKQPVKKSKEDKNLRITGRGSNIQILL